MLEFSLASEKEIRVELAGRLRKQRLAKGLSIEELAARSGVGVATLQRLETKGNSTFETFVRTVIALGLTQELQDIFKLRIQSIAQMEKAEQAVRKRASRKQSYKKAAYAKT